MTYRFESCPDYKKIKDMKHEFVNYNQALKLKELGFDEPCFGFYQLEYGEIRPTMVDDDEQYRLTGYRTCKNSEIPNHYTSAPTFSQAFRWFREKYELSFSIELTDNSRHYYYDFTISDSKNRDYNDEECFDSCKRIYDDGKFGKYEEAELACLDKLIQIVENKK